MNREPLESSLRFWIRERRCKLELAGHDEVKQDSPSMKGGWCCGSRNEEFLDERNETRPLGGEGKGGESCGAEMVSPLYLKVTRLGIFSFFFFLLFHSFVTRGDAWTV